MVDLKYTEKKAQTYNKVKSRIMAIKKGEKIRVAELTLIAMADGFTKKLVYDALDSFKEIEYVVVHEKDGRPFEIERKH